MSSISISPRRLLQEKTDIQSASPTSKTDAAVSNDPLFLQTDIQPTLNSSNNFNKIKKILESKLKFSIIVNSKQASETDLSEEKQENSKKEEKFKNLKNSLVTQIKTVIDKLDEEMSKRVCYNRSLKKYKFTNLKESSEAIMKIVSADHIEEIGKILKTSLMNSKLVSGKSSRTKLLIENLFNEITKDFSKLQIVKIEISAQIETFIKQLGEEVANPLYYNRSLKTYKITELQELLKKIASSSDLEELTEPFKQNLKDSKLIAGRSSRTKLLLESLLHKVEQIIYKDKCINLPYCAQINFNDLEQYGTIDFKKLYDRLMYYKSILNSNASFNHQDMEQKRLKPWMICFLNGSNELIQKYLKNSNTEKIEAADAPLHLAALGGSVRALRYTVKDLKIDPNSKDNFGNTILPYAVLSCSREALKYTTGVLKVGPNSKDKEGKNALHYSAICNAVEAMQCTVNDLKIDPNSKDHAHRNALHHSAMHNAVQAMQCAVNDLKIDPDSIDCMWMNALYYAAMHNSVQAMQCAVNDLKIDPNSKDNSGKNALLYAAMRNSVQAMQCAVNDLKIDPNSKDNSGKNALHHAAIHNAIQAMQYAQKDLKIDPNSEDNDGKNAYYFAAMSRADSSYSFT